VRRLQVEYEFSEILDIQIEDSALPVLKEAVEFWSDWEDNLHRNNGDYFKAFAENLAMFILRKNRLPNGDEGWVNFPNSYGINVLTWDTFTIEKDDLDIKEVA
jgi:hypothetical protein